jgi:NADH-quinone oxidoreductase subunit K
MSILYFLFVTFSLFIIGLYGVVLNKKNVLIILMAIELMLLSVNLNFIIFSLYLDDLLGQFFSLFILTVAAAESATGLAILVAYYRVRGTINIEQNQLLRG